jgi:hypothetical protein
MKSERENEVEFEGKIVGIEAGKVVMESSQIPGGFLVIPANEGFEKVAAGFYRKFVKVRIQIGSCLEPLSRG